MSQTVEMHIIARIRSDFPTKFGIPRQSGLADIPARDSSRNTTQRGCAARHRGLLASVADLAVFPPRCARGWSPTVRPPSWAATKRIGVFATTTLAVPPERDRTVLGAA